MMTATLRLKMKPNAMRDVRRHPKLRTFVDRTATKIARAVSAGAPRRTHRFARSISTAPPRLDSRDGWVGRVTTDDPFWHLEEYGSVNNPPHRSFERGTRAAGVKFRDHR